MSVLGNFLTNSTIYFPPITILPSLYILTIFSLSMKHSIDISVSLALKNNPFLFNSNFIPDKIGIKFLDEIALDTLFKFSIKISFLIINFILIPSFLYNILLIIILWIMWITPIYSYFMHIFFNLHVENM